MIGMVSRLKQKQEVLIHTTSGKYWATKNSGQVAAA